MNLSKRLEVLENKVSSGNKDNILFLTIGDPDNVEKEEQFLNNCKKRNISNPVIFSIVRPSLNGKK